MSVFKTRVLDLTKVVARIAATRLNTWTATFLTEEQNGFCKQRGIDDAHQIARRIIEEIVVSQHDKRVAVTCFDMVRVCRVALWQLLTRLGVPTACLQVLKALHEHTRFQVTFTMDSPPLG